MIMYIVMIIGGLAGTFMLGILPSDAHTLSETKQSAMCIVGFGSGAFIGGALYALSTGFDG